MQEYIDFSDVNLDFIPHPLTGNVSPKTNIEAIRQAIKVLFLLNPYDIPFNDSIFTNMNRYLFENFTHLTAANLVKRIEWAIKTYEKRVKYISAKAVSFDSDDGIEVTVTYQIKALNITDTLTQLFQRVR